MDEILNSAGNVRVAVYPVNAFANPGWATPAELDAGIPIEDLMDLGDYSPFIEASEMETRNPMGKKSAVEKRSSSNYGGSLNLGYPGQREDLQNLAAVAYQFFKDIRVALYLVWSIDGELGKPGQPKKDEYAAGDRYSIIKVWAGGWTDTITGEDPFSYERTLNRDGGIWVNRVVTATSGQPAIAITGTGLSGAVDDFGMVKVTAEGREFTRGAHLSSSDPSVARVSKNGVVSLVGAGTATITATLPGTSPVVSDTETVTVT